MRGRLADVNVQGHAMFLRHLLQSLDLWSVLVELGLTFATLRDLELPRDLDDRALWNFCQRDGWVLFTANRDQDGHDSLQATLADSWSAGMLPVLTLANKVTFEQSREYGRRAAADVAELLFGIAQNEYRHQPRIYVPRG